MVDSPVLLVGEVILRPAVPCRWFGLFMAGHTGLEGAHASILFLHGVVTVAGSEEMGRDKKKTAEEA